MTKEKLFIILIFITLFLRLFWLSKSPILPDEPAYIVRSFGWVDTLWSEAQTTPLDWFKVLPWWTSLSFHDHPPLTFLINCIFLNIGGFSLLVGRLASVLFGVGSVVWVYLIGKKIFNRNIALMAAILYLVNCLVVFFDRSAMMEAVSNFFILGSAWFFLQAVENKKYLFCFAVFAGLAILSKYIFLFFLPIYLLLILIYKRDWFKTKSFYLSILLFLLIISPLLIYNFYLFQYTHHFDVQLATLFHQKTPEWTVLLGKQQRYDWVYRLKATLFLIDFLSPLFMGLVFSAFIYIPLYYYKSKKNSTFIGLPRNLLYFSIIIYFFVLLYIGPAGRFVYYFMPWLCLLVTDFLWQITAIFYLPSLKIYAIFLLIEVLITTNVVFGTIYFGRPLGWERVTFPILAYQSDFGVEKLNIFLNDELKNYFPAKIPNYSHILKFNSTIKQNTINNDKISKKDIRLVYDSQMDFTAVFWSLVPKLIYQGWPIISDNLFFNNFSPAKLVDTTVYYVILTKENSRRENFSSSSTTIFKKEFLTNLSKQKITPTAINSTLGIPMFEVYKIPPEVLPHLFDKVGVTTTYEKNVLGDKNIAKQKRLK